MAKVNENRCSVIVIGTYRIPINKKDFQAWEQKLMLDVGFTDKKIKEEILRRLQYERS